MSNFTIGIFIPNSNQNILERIIKRNRLNWYLNEINNKWSILVTEDQFVIENSTLQKITKFSSEMPFLYFLDAEDHEWGFTIFNEGLEKVSIFVPHGQIPSRSDLNIEYILGIEEFKVFDISEKTINQISKILLNSNNLFENTWQQAKEFKKVVGIEEFY